MHEYYSTHGIITNPGQWASRIAVLPEDVSSLTYVLRGIIGHFADASQQGEELSTARLAEMDLRYVERMLERIVSLDDAPLSMPRNDSLKLTGCCRDFSVLLCSILRQHRIPARVRFGFSTIHIPGFHHDQTLLEYWHVRENRWCLVDARADEKFMQRYHLLKYSSIDLPSHTFLSAAKAWQLCRRGEVLPHRFGSFLAGRMSGLWFIRNKLIQDIAALNKMEMLQWDCWGSMLSDEDPRCISSQQAQYLDDIAAALLHSNNLTRVAQEIYQQSGITVPSEIVCFSVAHGRQFIKFI